MVGAGVVTTGVGVVVVAVMDDTGVVGMTVAGEVVVTVTPGVEFSVLPAVGKVGGAGGVTVVIIPGVVSGLVFVVVGMT